MTTAYLAADGLERSSARSARAGIAVAGEHGRLMIADGPRSRPRGPPISGPTVSSGRSPRSALPRRRCATSSATGRCMRPSSSARGADPGSAAACLGQACCLSRPRRRPRRWVPGPCSRRTGCWPRELQRRPIRTARSNSSRTKRARPPRLSETLGGAGPAAPLAAARRALPRSRRLAGRLDLCSGQARRQRYRGRQGAARSAGAACGVVARRECVRSRTRERRPGRLAVLRHHLLSRAAAAAGRALAGVGAGRRISSAPSSSRARPTMTRRRRSRPCRGRRSCICITTSTS